jgi:excisionase family DNA binding protein
MKASVREVEEVHAVAVARDGLVGPRDVAGPGDPVADGIAQVHCIHSDIVRWLQELADAAAPEDTDDPRLTWTIEEAADLAGFSRTTAYEAARFGEMPAIKVRGCWIVPRLTFLIWLLTGDAGAADLSRLIRAAITANHLPAGQRAAAPSAASGHGTARWVAGQGEVSA